MTGVECADRRLPCAVEDVPDVPCDRPADGTIVDDERAAFPACRHHADAILVRADANGDDVRFVPFEA